MAKAKKVKAVKAPKVAKKSKEVDAPFMPTIVEGLAKMVERLEILERKVDQVNGRISNILFEIRGEIQQNSRHQNASHEQNPFGYSRPQAPMPPQRQMYQVICADCKKNTEVPFKPGDRPVYCKECFNARKSGHSISNAPKSPLPAPIAVAQVSAKAKPAKKKKK